MKIQEFIEHLTARGYSPETVKAYRVDLRLFQSFLLEHNLEPEKVTAGNVIQFSTWLTQRHGRKDPTRQAPGSVARRLATISSYYTYLTIISNGEILNPVQIVQRPRRPKGQPQGIPDDTWTALIAGIDSLRDRAILTLFASSGLRLAELQRLNRDTIHVERQVTAEGVRVLGVGSIIRKGGNEGPFLVDAETLEILAAYLRERGNDSECALFLSSRNTRISKRNLQHILDRLCKRLNISRLHIHALRHTYAQHLADAGISSIALKELMGHSSFTTTQQYFRVNRRQLSSAYFAAMEMRPR